MNSKYNEYEDLIVTTLHHEKITGHWYMREKLFMDDETTQINLGRENNRIIEELESQEQNKENE